MGGGHECSLGDEFPQTVKRDALHAERSPYGTKALPSEIGKSKKVITRISGMESAGQCALKKKEHLP